jgi:hypothetical protein
VYEREAVLGRDARSVFPTEITKQAAADRASAAESLGGRNFITESEVGYAASWRHLRHSYSLAHSSAAYDSRFTSLSFFIHRRGKGSLTTLR